MLHGVWNAPRSCGFEVREIHDAWDSVNGSHAPATDWQCFMSFTRFAAHGSSFSFFPLPLAATGSMAQSSPLLAIGGPLDDSDDNSKSDQDDLIKPSLTDQGTTRLWPLASLLSARLRRRLLLLKLCLVLLLRLLLLFLRRRLCYRRLLSRRLLLSRRRRLRLRMRQVLGLLLGLLLGRELRRGRLLGRRLRQLHRREPRVLGRLECLLPARLGPGLRRRRRRTLGRLRVERRLHLGLGRELRGRRRGILAPHRARGRG